MNSKVFLKKMIFFLNVKINFFTKISFHNSTSTCTMWFQDMVSWQEDKRSDRLIVVQKLKYHKELNIFDYWLIKHFSYKCEQKIISIISIDTK